jgi:dCTP diphosphatase
MHDSLQQLTTAIRGFRDARDWKQFHNPKEMAIALVAEAGELLQHFVWQNSTQAEQRVQDRREQIRDEMADIGILLLEMADNCGIDLGAAIGDKLTRNEQRYPVERARGSNKKYNEL